MNFFDDTAAFYTFLGIVITAIIAHLNNRRQSQTEYKKVEVNVREQLEKSFLAELEAIQKNNATLRSDLLAEYGRLRDEVANLRYQLEVSELEYTDLLTVFIDLRAITKSKLPDEKLPEAPARRSRKREI